jgi:hypothetical protein
MSFNNFLSISKNPDISLRFVRDALTKTDMAGILFQISISSSPFASIRNVSYFQKEEKVLFSMHTVFREQTSDLVDTALYYNQLRSIEDNHGNHKEAVEYHEKST